MLRIFINVIEEIGTYDKVKPFFCGRRLNLVGIQFLSHLQLIEHSQASARVGLYTPV